MRHCRFVIIIAVVVAALNVVNAHPKGAAPLAASQIENRSTSTLAASATPQAPTTIPAHPVRYRHIERESPAMHVHVISIDLTDPRVRVRVCPGGDDPDGAAEKGGGPWQTQLRSVREIAEQNGLHCAINANYFAGKESRQLGGRTIPYFAGNWSKVWGLAMTDGKLWGDDPGSRCSLIIDRAGRATIDHFAAPLPDDAWQIVTGSELIVTDAKVTTTDGKDRAPRTSVGIDARGGTLTFVVVDGRKLDYSAGMTSAELAKEMIALGCHRAIMLDGGGSSTMVLRDPIDPAIVRVMNQPSDGHDLPVSMSLERPVANALGIEVRDESDK